MYAACLSLGLREGDEVLTPAFDCDSSLEPFVILGLKLTFFRQDPHTFNVDIEDLKNKISPHTKLLHIINHFGFPQPWEELARVRAETGIPMLEDNAYSLFSTLSGRPLGFFGDFSIFSLRKNLPIIEGGMLRVNNPQLNLSDYTERKLAYGIKASHLIKYLKDRIIPFHIAPVHIIKKLCFTLPAPVPLFSDATGYPKYSQRDKMDNYFSRDYLRPISYLAKKQLEYFSSDILALIAERKLFFYSLLVKEAKHFKGVTIINPDLPPGVIPHCLSLIINSRRDEVLAQLSKKYLMISWPTLSQRILNDLTHFPEVEYLGRKLLQIALPSGMILSKKFPSYIKRLIADLWILLDK